MIVMTGDYVNEIFRNDPKAINSLRNLLLQLQAPLGLYAVNGNVENPHKMEEWFKGLDIHILDDQIVRFPALGEHFALVGLSCLIGEIMIRLLIHLMGQIQPGIYRLLLFHKPDLAYTASRCARLICTFQVILMVGRLDCHSMEHLVANSRYGKQFEMGLITISDKTILFVSRGLGFAGGIAPRIRFLCPPEVVVIDLKIRQNILKAHSFPRSGLVPF